MLWTKSNFKIIMEDEPKEKKSSNIVSIYYLLKYGWN